jgi:hypothetical protein
MLRHTDGMARYMRLAIKSETTDQEYADLANTVWMLLRNTPHDFRVEHDGKTPINVLNSSWDQYGTDAQWE